MRFPRRLQKSEFNDFMISFSSNCIGSDRDALDWSGKKPLDYQKQLTSISASTFSSEYRVMSNVIVSGIQTVPRQNTMRNNRNRERVGIQRSFTMRPEASGSSPRLSIDDSNFDTQSIVSEAASTSVGTKRKEKRYRSSFLKKSMSRRRP